MIKTSPCLYLTGSGSLFTIWRKTSEVEGFIMTEELIVRGAPAEFVSSVGAWEKLPEHLMRRKLNRILVLHGRASWEAVRHQFPDLSNFETTFVEYGGQVTYEARDALKEKMEAEQFEAIVAVGGGKVSDLAKAAAFVSRVPVIMLPTLASTCAAYTPLSVMYTETGEMIQFDIFPVSNALVLLDPAIILDSPKELLVAGIGDTLAKWYEADVVIAELPEKTTAIEVAAFAARKCRDNLLRYSAVALNEMERHELGTAFVKVVETNIMLAGMVGGFGDKYGRTAGAHSIHDALTLLEKSHDVLHGLKVSYGILIQLVIEEKLDEIDALLPFYKKLGLPASLTELGLLDITEDELQQVAERAARDGEMIHLMPQTVTPIVVRDAMDKLEQYVPAIKVQ